MLLEGKPETTFWPFLVIFGKDGQPFSHFDQKLSDFNKIGVYLYDFGTINSLEYILNQLIGS